MVAQYLKKIAALFVGLSGTHRPGDSVWNADRGRRLAKKFGGTSETLYAPAYVENNELKQSFMKNGTIKETLDRAR
ncbi:hypothetical protein MASR2M36_36690 [Providencia sp.]